MAVLSSHWEEPVIIKDSLGDEYCHIPRRPFLFGKEKKRVQLIGPLYIGKYTVTKKQFKRFIEKTNYNYKLFDIMEQISPEPHCPATPVSWDDATAYAHWVKEFTGAYYSLPTEMEWEISSRGTDGRLYPWGNTPPTEKHGTFSLSVLRRQTNVRGRFPMNISRYGCVDMVGNVWEWCQNEVDEETDLPVLRGGACVDSEMECNCLSRRVQSNPHSRIMYAGFRLIHLTNDLYQKYCTIADEKSFTNTIR